MKHTNIHVPNGHASLTFDTCGPTPNQQIRPRLRRCQICTLPPPCQHQSLSNAKKSLIKDLQQYPINEHAPMCTSYFATGHCLSIMKHQHCIYHHPPVHDSPLVVLNTDHIAKKGHRIQYVPDLLPTKLDQKLLGHKCVLCRLHMKCSTHHTHSKYDVDWKKSQPQYVKPAERCPVCTLPMPCTHFTNVKELNLARKKEAAHEGRYPIDNTNANCIHWVQRGTCVMYDTLGLCLFWHPKSYANKRINLEKLTLDRTIAASAADSAHFKCEDHYYRIHGLSGLPGEHRSSGGSMKVGKSKLATEIQRQDSMNIAAARKRSFFPLNPKTGLPNTRQWNFPSPPLCKEILKEKHQEVWSLKKLLHKDKMKETEEDRDKRIAGERKKARQLHQERFSLQHKLWNSNVECGIHVKK